MAGVERVEQPAGERVAEIELVGADGEALDTDAEQLPFDGVAIEGGIDRIREDRVERLGEARRGPFRSTGVSFIPSGSRGWSRTGPERPAHRLADLPARDGVADPERPDSCVGVRERGVAGRLR